MENALALPSCANAFSISCSGEFLELGHFKAGSTRGNPRSVEVTPAVLQNHKIPRLAEQSGGASDER